jgi:hypothetical protein
VTARANPFFKTCAKHLRLRCALIEAMAEREAELDAIDTAVADPACTDEQRKVYLYRLAEIIRDETLHRRTARLQARMQRHLQSEECREILRQLDELAEQQP